MSHHDNPFENLAMESEEDFNRALHDLVEIARANGIDFMGGWSLNGKDGFHDLGVEIYRVVRNSD